MVSKARDSVIVTACWFTLLASSGIAAVYPVLIPVLQSDFGWSRTALAATMALGLAFRGLLAPVIGIIVDKMGVVRPAALGFALMAGSLAVLAGSNALWHLYAFFGVTLPIGVALCGSVLTTSLVSRLSSPQEGGFSYSVTWTGIHAGRFILPITAAFLLSSWGLTSQSHRGRGDEERHRGGGWVSLPRARDCCGR